jgi:glycosyltransferase involved in cell wall biosynthesis
VQSIADTTVILPTRNEARNIERFLGSLPDEIALVVVDKSEYGTTEIIGRTRPRRTEILSCPGSLTEARQIGALHATTRWLLFTDADIVFAADYFHRLALARDCGVLYGAKLSSCEYRRY